MSDDLKKPRGSTGVLCDFRRGFVAHSATRAAPPDPCPVAGIDKEDQQLYCGRSRSTFGKFLSGADALLKLGRESQLEDGIDQSTSKAPTAIMESTAFATSSAGQA